LIKLDALLVVLEVRRVEPDSAVRELCLHADLGRLDLLLTERRDLHRVKRPRVDAAALVPGRERRVEHQVVGDAVVERDAIVVALAVERIAAAAEAHTRRGQQRAVRRVQKAIRATRKSRRAGHCDFRAVRVVPLPLIELRVFGVPVAERDIELL
jgi:hypothetical protein